MPVGGKDAEEKLSRHKSGQHIRMLENGIYHTTGYTLARWFKRTAYMMEYERTHRRFFKDRRLKVSIGWADDAPSFNEVMIARDHYDILKVAIDQASTNLCHLSYLVKCGYAIHVENDYFHRYDPFVWGLQTTETSPVTLKAYFGYTC